MINFLPKIILYVSLLYLNVKAERKILIFGGNGFLGSDTAEKLIDGGDSITIVNRGNWYWDSEKRIKPFVKHINCDRDIELIKCEELVSFVNEIDKFDAVVDFSSYEGRHTRESSILFKDKIGIYILISTDSVYDVCVKKSYGSTQETDAVRPSNNDDVISLKNHHPYGHHKLEAEEEVLKQRMNGGFPFVILRLPDVLGPRDTSYRFWIYTLWMKIGQFIDNHQVRVPNFFETYSNSFVYSPDVANVIVKLLSYGPQILDQAINLAYPNGVTLLDLLNDMKGALNITNNVIRIQEPSETNFLFFYPTVRMGPIDVTKAENLIKWNPTPWNDMIKTSIAFYENAITSDRYTIQRDEIVQIITNQVFLNKKVELFEQLEKIYKLDLSHLRHLHDEL